MTERTRTAEGHASPQRYSRTLLLVAALLVVAGWVMLLDTGLVFQGQPNYAHFLNLIHKRALCNLIGILLLVLLWATPPKKLRGFSFWAMLLSIGLLALVWSPLGVEERGCRRWVAIGPLTFQPLEFAKLTLVWFLASTLSRSAPIHKAPLWQLIAPALLCAVAVGMVGAQPNLSGAVFLLLIAFVMAWIGGVNMRIALPMALGGVAAFAGLIALNPDRLARFIPVFSPLSDLQGAGYQAAMSLWAVTNGGLLGLGPGGSIAMYSLPDHTTDFIFSIICEEWGLMGGMLMLALFGLLGYCAFRLALTQRDGFRLMLGCGIASMLLLQAGINIGVALGLLPTTGVPLPFISTGGSSLVLALAEVGLLLNLGRTAEGAVGTAVLERSRDQVPSPAPSARQVKAVYELGRTQKSGIGHSVRRGRIAR